MPSKGSSYLIGHPELDADHDAMISIWRELEASRTMETAKMVAVRLMNETSAHFAREEEFMAQCRFPELGRHRALHSEMISSLRRVLLSPLMGSGKHEDFVLAVRSLMEKWISVHLVAEDSKLAPYARSQSGRMALARR
ncbi:MAG: hemerythrin family protein [Magnetospirillum sp.]|nr:hemerythrin family protein [Magnetospirillum sp.]MBI3707998.1 hemerythrin family protein [Pseudomonadota bacterium]